jgi:hypothetical protein
VLVVYGGGDEKLLLLLPPPGVPVPPLFDGLPEEEEDPLGGA